MQKAHKALENASWLIGCRAVRAVLNLFITMVTARLLGPSQFGLLHYAMSLTAFALPLMQLGFHSILCRELLKSPELEGEILGTSLMACSISGGLSMGGLLLFAALANPAEPETILVCGLYSLTLLSQAGEMILCWFQAHLLSRYSALASLCAYILSSGFRLLLLFRQKNLPLFAGTAALEHGLTAGALLLLYRHLGGKKLRFSSPMLKRLWNSGKFCIFSGLLVAVFVQTDTVMLKAFLGEKATGYYSAAAACTGMTNFFFAAILETGAPLIYESAGVSPEKAEKRMTCLYSLILLFSLAQSLFLAVFAGPVVRLLYGRAYLPSAWVLRVLIFYTVFSYLGAARNIWLLAEGKQDLLWKLDLPGALLNVFLNGLMIPVLGIYGAAWATILTQLFTNVILVLVRKDTRKAACLMGKALDFRILGLCVRELAHKNKKKA